MEEKVNIGEITDRIADERAEAERDYVTKMTRRRRRISGYEILS